MHRTKELLPRAEELMHRAEELMHPAEEYGGWLGLSISTATYDVTKPDSMHTRPID